MIEIPVGFAWFLVAFHALWAFVWNTNDFLNVLCKLSFAMTTLFIFSYIIS